MGFCGQLTVLPSSSSTPCGRSKDFRAINKTAVKRGVRPLESGCHVGPWGRLKRHGFRPWVGNSRHFRNWGVHWIYTCFLAQSLMQVLDQEKGRPLSLVSFSIAFYTLGFGVGKFDRCPSMLHYVHNAWGYLDLPGDLT